MQLTTILVALLAGFATAAPASAAKRSNYMGISLSFHIDIPGVTPFEEPAPIQIHKFNSLKDSDHVAKISFEHDYHINVDINSVECQAYSDHRGTKPLGSFTNKSPLILDPAATVGSLLCYIA